MRHTESAALVARRLEIRTKALRAAAGVALFTGAVSCGTAGTEELTRPGRIVAGPADAGFAADAEPPPPVDAGFVDAGEMSADSGVCSLEQEDYVACCDAINWDFNRGCMAWGPPVPPEMEVA